MEKIVTKGALKNLWNFVKIIAKEYRLQISLQLDDFFSDGANERIFTKKPTTESKTRGTHRSVS